MHVNSSRATPQDGISIKAIRGRENKQEFTSGCVHQLNASNGKKVKLAFQITENDLPRITCQVLALQYYCNANIRDIYCLCYLCEFLLTLGWCEVHLVPEQKKKKTVNPVIINYCQKRFLFPLPAKKYNTITFQFSFVMTFLGSNLAKLLGSPGLLSISWH